MRTLKKSLSLVLVLAMVFSFCAFGTSAAYVDADKIEDEFLEAVEVLSALEILKGDERGFRPDDTLTRAEACVIITKMLGAADVAKSATTSFTDAANHWAAKYIGYCESIGVVSGNGDGTFGPDSALTGYAFSLMVLRAIGYEPKYEGIGGSDWELDTAKLAKEVELIDDMSLIAATSFTREMAAQIAFTGLVDLLVMDYEDGFEITIGGQGGTTVIGKPDRTPKDYNLLGNIFGVVQRPARDAYGNPAHRYELTKTRQTIALVSLIPDAVIENKMISHLDVIAALNIGDVEGYTIDTYIANSKVEDDVELSDEINPTKMAFCGTPSAAAPVSGLGSYANVYLYDTNKIDVVIVNTYAGKITTVNKDGSIVIDGQYLYVAGLKGAAKGDDVIYTIGEDAKLGDVAVTVKAAEIVEGAITEKITTKGIVDTVVWTIGGVERMKSFTCTDSLNGYVVVEDEPVKVKFYVDNYGNIISDQVKAPDVYTTGGYIYVLDVDDGLHTVEGWKDHDYSYLTVLGVNEKGVKGYYDLYWAVAPTQVPNSNPAVYKSVTYAQEGNGTGELDYSYDAGTKTGTVTVAGSDTNTITIGDVISYEINGDKRIVADAGDAMAAFVSEDVTTGDLDNGDTKLNGYTLNSATEFYFVYNYKGSDVVTTVVGNTKLGGDDYAKYFIIPELKGGSETGFAAKVFVLEQPKDGASDSDEFVYFTGEKIKLHEAIDPETLELVIDTVELELITMAGEKKVVEIDYELLVDGYSKGFYNVVDEEYVAAGTQYGNVLSYKNNVVNFDNLDSLNVTAKSIVMDESTEGNGVINAYDGKYDADYVTYIVDSKTNSILWAIIIDNTGIVAIDTEEATTVADFAAIKAKADGVYFVTGLAEDGLAADQEVLVFKYKSSGTTTTITFTLRDETGAVVTPATETTYACTDSTPTAHTFFFETSWDLVLDAGTYTYTITEADGDLLSMGTFEIA